MQGDVGRMGQDLHASAKNLDRTANPMRVCVFVAVHTMNTRLQTMVVIEMAAVPTNKARVWMSCDAAQCSNARR